MQPSAYQFQYDATSNQWTFDSTIITIQNAPPDVDWSRWAFINAYPQMLFFVQTTDDGSVNLYTFYYNSTENAFIRNTNNQVFPALTPITGIPQAASLNSITMSYDGSAVYLYLNSAEFSTTAISSSNTIYEFIYNPSSLSFELSNPTGIQITNAPADIDWSRFAMDCNINDGTCYFYGFQVGGQAVYQAVLNNGVYTFNGTQMNIAPITGQYMDLSQCSIVNNTFLYLVYDESYLRGLSGGTGTGKNADAVRATQSYNYNSWVGSLPDQSALISSINLPGTHDSAAINQYILTPWACQTATIKDQLNGGVRLLDIRIQVQPGILYGYNFYACHGSLGSGDNFNQYQSLPSLLTECSEFLSANLSEFIVMSVKIDDWANFTTPSAAVYDELQGILYDSNVIYTGMVNGNYIPTIQQVKGQIYLLNRINDDINLGIPLSWPDNALLNMISFALPNNQIPTFTGYVQDQYKELPWSDYQLAKFTLFMDAVNYYAVQPSPSILLNFASATYCGVIGVDIMSIFVSYMGGFTAANRPAVLGWSFFDKIFSCYQIEANNSAQMVNSLDLIIDSNFNYVNFPGTFTISLPAESKTSTLQLSSK